MSDVITPRVEVRPTNAVTPPTELYGEGSTWPQNLLGAADNAHWIPLTPVQDGGTEDLIELSVLRQKSRHEFIVQGLNILDVGVFQPVFPSLVDLKPLMRNTSLSTAGHVALAML